MALFGLFGPKAVKTAKRAYSAASHSKSLRDWMAGSTNQDAETRMALRSLRNRSRDLARNNSYFINALRIMTNNVIGQGVKMQAQVTFGSQGRGANKPNKRINEAIEKARTRWKRADSSDVTGQRTYEENARLAFLSTARDGECLVRMVPQAFGASRIPLALEVIEADHLDEEMNGRAKNGNEIRMGVEVNAWGRPVAYHLFQKHPGDYQRSALVGRPRIRIPAEEIIHLFRPERAGQTRGVPWGASAMEGLRHMGGVETAEVVAARAAACQMGFIQTPDGDFEDDGVEGGERVTVFEPGKISVLGPGETFVSHTPSRPTGLLEPFMRYMLRGFAAGMGVAYSAVGMDYGQANYSASRLELLNERDNYRALQAWWIAAFEQRIYERWLEMAVLSGQIALPGYEVSPELYDTPKWVARGWSWVDPAKEVRAYKEAVRAGFMTQSDVIMYAGGEFDEFVVARRREVEAAKESKLVFDTDPAEVTGSGQAQVDPADNVNETPTTTDGSGSENGGSGKTASDD